MENGKSAIYVAPAVGGVPEKACEDCLAPYSFSSNGGKILYWPNAPGPAGIALLDLASGQKTDIVRRAGYGIYRSRFSSDDRWITFHGRNRPDRSAVFVVPFRGAAAIPERDWIAVTDGESYDIAPYWSPDGGVLYFLSERDGFRCVWAQRLNPATKRPEGPPLAMQHFHTATRSMVHLTTNWLGLSASRDKLVFNLGEVSGNIWMAKPEGAGRRTGGP
jgi:Tol biopolymer transport system component